MAVLIGLVFVRAGFDDADSAAALFVAVLVLVAAGRLIRRNVDVLMDRAPADAYEAAQAAIRDIEPPVQLRRLRIRQAAGRHFADVVIGVAPDAAVAQGHAAADAVEEAIERALPRRTSSSTWSRSTRRGSASASRPPRVRAAGTRDPQRERGRRRRTASRCRSTSSCRARCRSRQAHDVASKVEEAIQQAAPEVSTVQTHLEPLSEGAAGREPSPTDMERDSDIVGRIVREATGQPPRALRFLRTEDGLVAFLTLALDPNSELAEAHSRASEIEERIRAGGRTSAT